MRGVAPGNVGRLLLVAIPSSVLAQSSPSHTQTEHVFNAGGRPAQAVTAASPSYRISLDSIGGPIAGRLLIGSSYRLAGGLAAVYPPPGEVEGLQILADRQTLLWSSEPSSTVYNVYAGLLASLPGGLVFLLRKEGLMVSASSSDMPKEEV